MATIKISQLPPATIPLSSTDVVAAVQSGTTVKATVASLFTAQTTQNFTGTGSQVAFTLTKAPNGLNVYVNGVYQNHSSFSVVGTTLTFSQAPPVTSAIEAVYT
jgi:hypothetical protein